MIVDVNRLVLIDKRGQWTGQAQENLNRKEMDSFGCRSLSIQYKQKPNTS